MNIVTEATGHNVDADDLLRTCKDVAEQHMKPGCRYFSTRVYDGAVYLDSVSAERNWMRLQMAARPW